MGAGKPTMPREFTSRALHELDADEVTVDVHPSNRSPSFTLVGPADTEVKGGARASARASGTASSGSRPAGVGQTSICLLSAGLKRAFSTRSSASGVYRAASKCTVTPLARLARARGPLQHRARRSASRWGSCRCRPAMNGAIRGDSSASHSRRRSPLVSTGRDQSNRLSVNGRRSDRLYLQGLGSRRWIRRTLCPALDYLEPAVSNFRSCGSRLPHGDASLQATTGPHLGTHGASWPTLLQRSASSLKAGRFLGDGSASRCSTAFAFVVQIEPPAVAPERL